MTAQLTVVVDRVPDALSIPIEASFQKSGQTVAYVWEGSKFEEHVIEIGRRNRDRILVTKGLRPGDRVAAVQWNGPALLSMLKVAPALVRAFMIY